MMINKKGQHNLDPQSNVGLASTRFNLKQVASTVSKSLGMALSMVLITPSASAQQVALLDTGIDPDAGYNVAGGFNYFLNDSDTSDVSPREGEGHGTVSARLVSEAFSGGIVPYVVTDGLANGESEDQSRVARDSAFSDILGNDSIRVVGVTWATSGVAGASASLMPSLSEANKFVAIAAGNNGSTQPNALATTSFNLQGVIIVGATDYEGVILPYSNQAGTTQNRYVAAIGLPDEDAELGGTSWATARIAGIAGAVLLQNPNLTAEEVADVIFRSAEDRGVAGTDSVYGRGVILTAEQVLNNVMGPVTVPVVPEQNGSGGSSGGGGGGAGLLLGGALAGVLLLSRKPSEKLEKTLVLDSYGRTFSVDLGEHVAIDDESLALEAFFNSLEQTSLSQAVYLPRLNTQVAMQAISQEPQVTDMIAYFAMDDDRVIHDGRAHYAMALQSQLSDRVNLSVGHRVNPNLYFGGIRQLNDNENFGRASFLSGQSFGSILNGFSANANSLSLDYQNKLGKSAHGVQASLGLVSVDENTRFGKESFSTLFQGGYEFADHGGISLQFGQIQEQGSLFGGAAGGIFGVEQATTYAVNLSGHVRFSDHVSLLGNYGIGRTRVDAERESLLSNFSTMTSDWFSLGLVANDVWSRSDQFGVSISQPLKINSGGLDYSIPIQRDSFGDIAFDTERVNLGDVDSSEQRYEMYYRNQVSSKMEVGAFLSFRDDPNHVSTEGDETILMFTLRYRP